MVENEPYPISSLTLRADISSLRSSKQFTAFLTLSAVIFLIFNSHIQKVLRQKIAKKQFSIVVESIVPKLNIKV